MRNKIKMLKMCTMLLRFGLIHICSSDSSSANFSLTPLSITLNMIRGCEIRLIVLYFLMIRKLPLLGSDVVILSIKIVTTLTRFSFWQRHPLKSITCNWLLVRNQLACSFHNTLLTHAEYTNLGHAIHTPSDTHAAMICHACAVLDRSLVCLGRSDDLAMCRTLVRHSEMCALCGSLSRAGWGNTPTLSKKPDKSKQINMLTKQI